MTDFNQKLEGLLGSPVFNMGMGLLAEGGPRLGPKVSFGQALAGASRHTTAQQRQFQQLQLQRELLQQQKNRQKAIKSLPGLLNNNAPASIKAPPQLQQQRLMGLLTQIAPQQVAQGLLSQQFAQPQRLPNSIQEVMAVTGLQPGMPGFEEAFNKIKNPPNSSQQLADTLAAQQIQANLRAQENKDLERKQQTRRKARGAQSSISEINRLLDLMDQAEGTAAQPGYLAGIMGSGASLKAGVSNLFGETDKGAEKTAELVQKMNKGFSRLSTSTIPDTFMGSDNKLSFFSSQLPSVDLELGTNITILESYLQGIIDEDLIDDGEINTSDGAQSALERIKKLKSTPPPGFELEQ
jgi:hypothetical protein